MSRVGLVLAASLLSSSACDAPSDADTVIDLETSADGKFDGTDFKIEVPPGEVRSFRFISDRFGMTFNLTQPNGDVPSKTKLYNEELLQQGAFWHQPESNEPAAEYEFIVRPDLQQLKKTSYPYIFEVFNAGNRPLEAIVTIGDYDAHPCKDSDPAFFGHAVEGVARCQVVSDGNVGGDARSHTVEADLCVGRGRWATSTSFEKAGDPFAFVDGRLAYGNGSGAAKQDVLQHKLGMIEFEGTFAREDEATLEGFETFTSSLFTGKLARFEHSFAYDKQQQVLRVTRRYKEKGLFERWVTEVDFELECEPLAASGTGEAQG